MGADPTTRGSHPAPDADFDPWAELLADPAARARLDRGTADMKAGRVWPFWLVRKDRRPGYRFACALWRVLWFRPFRWGQRLAHVLRLREQSGG